MSDLNDHIRTGLKAKLSPEALADKLIANEFELVVMWMRPLLIAMIKGVERDAARNREKEVHEERERVEASGMTPMAKRNADLNEWVKLAHVSFRLGNGESVTWLEATVPQLRLRIELQQRNMAGSARNIRDIEAAIAKIESNGCENLKGVFKKLGVVVPPPVTKAAAKKKGE